MRQSRNIGARQCHHTTDEPGNVHLVNTGSVDHCILPHLDTSCFLHDVGISAWIYM